MKAHSWPKHIHDLRKYSQCILVQRTIKPTISKLSIMQNREIANNGNFPGHQTHSRGTQESHDDKFNLKNRLKSIVMSMWSNGGTTEQTGSKKHFIIWLPSCLLDGNTSFKGTNTITNNATVMNKTPFRES